MNELQATDSLPQGSRLTRRIEFIMTCGELDEDFKEHYESLSATTEEITNSVPGATVELFETSHGRGASGAAIGLIVSLIGAPGGLYATVQVVRRIFQRLRKNGEHPCLSLGAATHLCIADVFAKNRSLRPEEIYVLLAIESGSAEYPYEGMALDQHIYAGDELFLVVIADTRNTRSWLYLVDTHGGILHYSIGKPLPAGVLFYRGRPWDYDYRVRDTIDHLCDEDE